MDRAATLNETLRGVIKSYATVGYNGNGDPSKLYFVENEQEQAFAVIGPYDPAIKQAHLILMAHILNDQVIIDQDNTSISLRDELRFAGIPDDQIILAWHQN